jgi:hypothetical protein
MRWYSGEEGIGEGSQVITASENNRRVETDLEFGDQGKGQASFNLARTDGETELTWTFRTDFGWDIFGRYVGLMLDNMIGAAYNRGLAKLKTRIEAPAGDGDPANDGTLPAE